jgi:3D (Asp-Asp-Asp) domain-containing protein
MVSGHPTMPTRRSPVLQSGVVLPSASVQQKASPVNVIGTAKAQPELMHEAAADTTTAAVPHRRIVKMLVTAYCPCAKCCGENAAGITASGKLVDYNNGHFVAADPSLHFGTKVIIPGYSNSGVEVVDRGGAIKGNHIDVFFPTHEQALQWGKQTLNVIVMD